MKKTLKLFTMLLLLLSLSGCKKYYVDKDNIKSINEIEITILEKLNKTYDQNFEIDFMVYDDYKICEFALHECISFSNVEGAKKYIFDGKDEEGRIFTITYVDPFYDEEGNYNTEEIKENYLEEKENISSEYHIKYYDDSNQNVFYNLKFAKTGRYTLYVQNYNSLEEMDVKYNVYSQNLNKSNTKKITEILDYIKEKESINNDIYIFYYDSELQRSKISYESEGYLQKLLYAMKSIASEGKIEDMSSKEYGIKMIDDLYDEIFNSEKETQND